MVHSWATNVDDPTDQPRWGKIGKQKIEDAGPNCCRSQWKRHQVQHGDNGRHDPRPCLQFIDKAKADGKPFFVWMNPTRMHVVTHLSPKYRR